MDWGKVIDEARKRGAQAVELLKEGWYELSWDVRDAAKTGFGVPKLLSSTASLGVATVAAAGGASVAFDFVGKIWGKKECVTCNGWEGLRCQICGGVGKVHFNVNASSLNEDDRSSSQSMAAAVLDGRAQIEYVADVRKLDLPYPSIDCPQCDGTGVMKCVTCNGDAWVPKFTIAKAMDAPWLTWDAYQKIDPPSEPPDEVRIDPGMIPFEKLVKDELEQGIQYDEDFEQAVAAKFEMVPTDGVKVKVTYLSFASDARQYDVIREQVARRNPGWETLQEVLFMKDPQRAVRDPVIVSNPPYYKAKMKIANKVGQLPVPPRPADWLVNIEKPLSESDWTENELKDPRKRSEMKVLLEEQEKFFNKLLDRTWENHWRTQKFEEVKQETIESYEQGRDGIQQPAEPEAQQMEAGMGPSPSVSSTTQAKPIARKKADARKRPEDDKKRRERQERGERMARQAAEREAALSKAKAARESRGAQ